MLRRWISVLDWLPHYRRADLGGDVVAGLTGAAVLVPQSMAYAQIAHLPPVVGLYASVVPLLAYAVLGRVPAARDRPAGFDLDPVRHRRGQARARANVDDGVRDVMDASGLTELLGRENFFPTDADAVAHLDARARSES
jgi:hypothetical protein